MFLSQCLIICSFYITCILPSFSLIPTLHNSTKQSFIHNLLVRKRPVLLSISSFEPVLCIDLILIVINWLGICCVNDISLNIYVKLFTISSPPFNIISFVHFFLLLSTHYLFICNFQFFKAFSTIHCVTSNGS